MGFSKESVGVIIPFYGSKQKLFRTLESVEYQTVAPEVVLLIDDCGPDPLTKEDELYWEGRIPQLEYVYNEQNLGAGLTRNVGMDCLEGKVVYVHFLDSDDCMAENFYEVMLRSRKL
jgi:succinoglycan biosynthesis protein ExoO